MNMHIFFTDDTKSPSPQACGEGSSLTPDPQSPTPPGVTLAPLTRLRSVQVVTVQAVLSAETRPDPKSPSVQLSVSHVNANLGVTTNHIGKWDSTMIYRTWSHGLLYFYALSCVKKEVNIHFMRLPAFQTHSYILYSTMKKKEIRCTSRKNSYLLEG